MPRLARVVVPECPHHVTQRGNARPDVFYTPGDRQVYLRLLQQYSEHYSLRILRYCPNAQPRSPGRGSCRCSLAPLHAARGARAAMRDTGTQSSPRPVTFGRVDTIPAHFEAVRLASVMRYVALNPVRAGLVRVAEGCAWSSALMYLGGSDGADLLDRVSGR
jgi:putative transposase